MREEKTEDSIESLLSRRDFDKARAMISDQLQSDPQNPDTHYFMGVLCYFRGQVGQAAEWLKKALKLDPRHTDAAICLSVLLNDIGKYDDAKKVFEKANHSVNHRQIDDLKVDRKFAVKHLELADLYARYRRYDEAIEEYTKATRLNPKALDIRIRMAKAYARKGFLTRSMQELQQLKREFPKYTPPMIQLGLLHYSQGNILDAELEWENVISLDSNNKEARAYLNMAQKARQAV